MPPNSPTAADFITLAEALLEDAEGLIAQHLDQIEAAEASGRANQSVKLVPSIVRGSTCSRKSKYSQ